MIEYLKTPPSRDELQAPLRPRRHHARAKACAPRSRWRPSSASLGDDVSDDAILDAMVEHPILINRPLVETEKGVRLCRPQDMVREIL